MATTEKEMRAGRELDALVAERVMGWPHISVNEPYRRHKDRGGVIVVGMPQKFSAGLIPSDWRPSWYIAEAWDVIAELAPKFWATLLTPYDAADIYHVSFTPLGQPEHSHRAGHAMAETMEVAICLAALKAVGQPQDTRA